MTSGHCVRCVCCKSGLLGTNCYPSRNGRCQNVSSPLTHDQQPQEQPRTSEQLQDQQPQEQQRVSEQLQDGPGPFQPRSDSNFFPVPRTTILKRIPKASREQCGRKLATILNAIVSKNDRPAWERLFRFSLRCLRALRKASKHRSLASAVNRQLSEEMDAPFIAKQRSLTGRPSRRNPAEVLASRVSAKLEEGDFKGAIRLVCSEDTIADKSAATFSSLVEKHPAPHPDN